MGTSVLAQNDFFKTQAKSVALVAATEKLVIGPLDIGRHNVKTFTVKNAGSNPLTAAKIQAQSDNPDAPDADWEDVDTTTFASLAAAGVKSVNIADDARQYWRVKLTSTLGTTVHVFATAHA